MCLSWLTSWFRWGRAPRAKRRAKQRSFHYTIQSGTYREVLRILAVNGPLSTAQVCVQLATRTGPAVLTTARANGHVKSSRFLSGIGGALLWELTDRGRQAIASVEGSIADEKSLA